MAAGTDGPLYLGVDVGGTKVLAAVVEESGQVVARQKCRTPRGVGPGEIIDAIETATRGAVGAAGAKLRDVRALGVAVPGVVDPKKGRVVVAPNMNFDNVDVGPLLEERLGRPIALGNDCNLGALGEQWLGAGQGSKSVFAMLWGTGIGGGIVRKGKMWRGARESAAEIGHIIMQIGGPECGCGNLGCFEALASRTAIERDIRQALDAGRSSMITELADGKLDVIRSGMLRRALEANDEVVTEILHRAANVVGHACLTVRHLIDPEVIVLGGGVIEACGQHLMPIIHGVVDADQLPGAHDGGRVFVSALGDDAVVVGAVALARKKAGRNPFKKKYRTEASYPKLSQFEPGAVTVGGKRYKEDVFIRVDAKVKKRKRDIATDQYGTAHLIGAKELKKICRGGPKVLFIGTGVDGNAHLADDAAVFLQRRAIQCELLPSADVIDAYNDCTQRKALLLHVSS